MNLQETLSLNVKQAIKTVFDAELESVEFQATRKEFAGDITVVVFPMLRVVKGNPVQIGEKIGQFLVENVEEVTAFNVVKGFLNIEINDDYYINFFNNIKDQSQYGFATPNSKGKAVMVEYSSPNTNKPLHLGHVRNVILGYSVSNILKASGKKVYKTQIINDRGIHICKSMLAWKRFGNEETPQSSGLKGDKLVGNYYVKFEEKLKEQAKPIFNEYINGNVAPPFVGGHKIKFIVEEISKLEKIKENYSLKENQNELNKVETKISELTKEINDFARNQTDLMKSAYVMLQKWEAGDLEVVSLWEKMNSWVYEGFDTTYKSIGVDFDKLYYESQTYLLGKEFVAEGLKSGVFFKKEDGSVWCDLTEDGLDEKIVLRSDGTAVYMTQDIGTAIQRVKDFPDVGGMVYTVGNEQEYHFQVLFLIIKKLGFDWADNLYHLSYGMVDLPSGKMKSREGTVVDADDLVDEMAQTAGEISEELGKLDGYSQEEKQDLYKTIGLGALKYFILKVDPRKRILFDPKESIDFQGNTGPFIQYTYARIQSVLRKAGKVDSSLDLSGLKLHPKEKELLKQLELFPEVINNAASNYSPALIANYTYDLVKAYNSFFQNLPIVIGNEDEVSRAFRIGLSQSVSNVIKSAFGLLGINVPERM